MPEFFDYLKALYNKDKLEYDAAKFNPWQMLMFVSHDKEHFYNVEAINKYLFVINPKYIWKYLRYKLPYSKNKFLRYIKKSDSGINNEIIEALQTEYGISKQEAKLLYDSYK